MNANIGGYFWNDYFQEIFIPQINMFYNVIINHFLPTLDDTEIEEKATQKAQKTFDHLCSLPAEEFSNVDIADIADQAFEDGLAYYHVLKNTRQAILNLMATALYHIFEQQLIVFYRRQILPLSEKNNSAKLNVKEIKKDLQKNINLDIESIEAWLKINELRLLANAVKHAEGRSSEELKKLRPDLFNNPALQNKRLSSFTASTRVYLPLAGQDIYTPIEDLENYRLAIIMFWEEFGEAIRKHDEKQV